MDLRFNETWADDSLISRHIWLDDGWKKSAGVTKVPVEGLSAWLVSKTVSFNYIFLKIWSTSESTHRILENVP